jgi:hypothetical protein
MVHTFKAPKPGTGTKPPRRDVKVSAWLVIDGPRTGAGAQELPLSLSKQQHLGTHDGPRLARYLAVRQSSLIFGRSAYLPVSSKGSAIVRVMDEVPASTDSHSFSAGV